jgi:hypothetical protein
LYGEFISFLRIEDLLGIIQSAQLVVLRQYHGAGYDRSREWRHTGFIHAGDESIPISPELNLKAQEEVQTLTFGTILTISLADASCELMGALPPINIQGFK